MFSLFGNNRAKAMKDLAAGDYPSAIRKLRQLAERTPDDCELQHNLGIAYLQSGDAASSVACFLRANDIRPAAMHFNNLGRAYLDQGDHEAARDAFTHAAELAPDDPQPQYNLTVLLREQGDAAASFRALVAFAERFPGHAGACNDLAMHCAEQGEPARAVGFLQRALASDPAYATARLNLVRILCEAGRLPDAKPHLEEIARQGVDVHVSAEEGKLAIALNGRLFYLGRYAP